MKAFSALSLGAGVVAIVVVGAVLFSRQDEKRHNEIAEYLGRFRPEFSDDLEVTEKHGLYPEPARTETLIEQSNLIIEAQVLRLEPPYKDEKGLVYHNVILEPQTVLKGDQAILTGDSIVVTVYGGRIGDEWFWAEDGPTYSEGEKVLVFLSKDEMTYYTTYGAFGKVNILADGSVEGINEEEGYFKKPLADYERKLNSLLVN